MLLYVTLVSPCPSLSHFRGRQPKREGDGRRPPSIPLRLIAAMRRPVCPCPVRPPLSSLMKYRLVFVGGKGRRKELDSLTGSLEAGWFPDVPLPSVSQFHKLGSGRERKTMGWLAELLLPLQYRLFWQRRRRGWRAARKRRGRMYRSTGGMARKEGRRGGRQEKAVGLINTLRRHWDRVVVESFRLKS